MDRRKVARLISVAIGVLGVALVIALSHAAPPGPKPRPKVRRRLRAKRLARPVVLRRRRRLALRRLGPRMVVTGGGAVVREMSAPLVVTSAESLKKTPVKDFTESAAYRVVRVDSNGTVVLKMGEKDTPVRLIGVDSALPENAGEAEKKQVHRTFRNLFVGEFVYVEYDSALARQDEEGAMVAYLYRAPDKLFLNLELIRQGCALAAADYPYQHQELCRFYESKAQADGKGLWETPPPSAPTGEEISRLISP